jgi:hypothetical protein
MMCAFARFVRFVPFFVSFVPFVRNRICRAFHPGEVFLPRELGKLSWNIPRKEHHGTGIYFVQALVWGVKKQDLPILRICAELRRASRISSRLRVRKAQAGGDFHNFGQLLIRWASLRQNVYQT